MKTKERGITLIALVVTIIVLLILAGVSIAMLTGQTGILKNAQQAREETTKGEIRDDVRREILERMTENLGDLSSKDLYDILDRYFDLEHSGEENNIVVKAPDAYTEGEENPWEAENFPEDFPELHSKEGNYPFKLGDLYSGDLSGTQTGNIPPTPPTLKTPQIKDRLNQVIDENNNTTVYDEFNNSVTIPAGFKIVPNGTNNVTYGKYSKNPASPTVQDGIVVADGDGNQFVWIPVGTINDDKDGTTTEIQLARYKFNATSNHEEGENGEATPKQTAEVYDEDASSDTYRNYRIYRDNDETESYYYYESTTGLGNTVANTLQGFIESVIGKEGKTGYGGYYLARYEAGQESEKVVSKAGTVWNSVIQKTASKKSGEMYSSSNFTSDLTNSYAWDTAIVFIQKYSGDEDYSKETAQTFSSSLRNTGAGTDENDTDKRCNIYDMASNCQEWTTETCTLSRYPCVKRGGKFGTDKRFTADRVLDIGLLPDSGLSFRPILYVALNTGHFGGE